MTQQDIDRMRATQAVDILDALERRLGWSVLTAWRVDGAWYVTLHPPTRAPVTARGISILDAMAQVAQALIADDPGPFDHDAGTREPVERLAS